MTSIRPPQQARSVATRNRLIDAAKERLIHHGYAGTSTASVAQAAGVSQGALFKHFEGKSLLIGAVAGSILTGFIERFRHGIKDRLPLAHRAHLDSRLAPALAALWAVFRQPEMRALFEIYVAARTDTTLEQQLAPRLVEHREAILDEARAIFPELAAHPDLDGVIDAIVFAMQGAVLGLFGADESTDERQLAFFERLARRELEHLLQRGP